MNVNSFLLERALKQLKVSEDSLAQFRFVSASGNVGGNGFPAELFELSAPVIIRGLLNFSVLQMNRDWIYPFWVRQQLDPTGIGFVATSQNPLLVNTTHRNWTTLGSPTGYHEAVVDPRGLLTPLPREWSLDAWLMENGQCYFPSLAEHVSQTYDTKAPCIATHSSWQELTMKSEAFVGSVRGGSDIVFCRLTISNPSARSRNIMACVAVRPFGPEGVAPIQKIDFSSRRVATVDGGVGVVFAQDPDRILFGNARLGDTANRLLADTDHKAIRVGPEEQDLRVSCDKGLANATALFELILEPGSESSVNYSVALGTRSELAVTAHKRSWKVSFERRREEQRAVWMKEAEGAAVFEFADHELQNLFEACKTTLLQLQDGEFISPGPYLYHHFWFRDAAPMLKALDVLGFFKRSRQVIDGFPKRQKPDGFFQAPAGEWDSNGAVLWSVYEHYRLTRSLLWLKQLYPSLARGGRWIMNMKSSTKETASTHKGLMPRSLSAEHLGTVDQYYWDSFWSLAGLRSLAAISREIQRESDEQTFQEEANRFEEDILRSLQSVEKRLGEKLIPSTPFRAFDESAIGSIASIYPLGLFGQNFPYTVNTLKTIAARFVDNRGFYHPIIHSGYNPYLTLQVAHAFLCEGEISKAWDIAESIFHQATSSYTFPEAIHPKTNGGAMGDGHHGWAAAEVILFIRACLLREGADTICFFQALRRDC